MNYWSDTDGEDSELAGADQGTSTMVQAHFPGARVVKSLNQLGITSSMSIHVLPAHRIASPWRRSGTIGSRCGP
jgi:hypothetical protein